MSPVYKTTVTAVGGRNGRVKSEDGVIEMDVRLPKELGGAGGSFTNPEQLFAAGYAACFDSALNYAALLSKIKVSNTSVEANVGIINDPASGFSLAVTLNVSIPGIERSIAMELLDKAHKTCPYSKAVANNVDVKINLL